MFGQGLVANIKKEDTYPFSSLKINQHAITTRPSDWEIKRKNPRVTGPNLPSTFIPADNLQHRSLPKIKMKL